VQCAELDEMRRREALGAKTLRGESIGKRHVSGQQRRVTTVRGIVCGRDIGNR
jgi:hypothetical protein